MWSNYFVESNKLFVNCMWLSGTAFYNRKATDVFKAVLNAANNMLVNETTARIIPMSICRCNDNERSTCKIPNLGNVFPGQTVSIGLHVSNLHARKIRSPITLVVINVSECNIVHTSQLAQAHLTSGCNVYSYTLWPNNYKMVTTCKLFIGLSDLAMNVADMFYVTLDHCPIGFTPQPNKKACDCDPVLENSFLSIESCNVYDGTILRPAKSWINADGMYNGIQSYCISKQCPLDYCLPYSLYIDLSVPDMQCQSNRSGVLCGQCQDGLSTVFGSSKCKHCSNKSLFIIAPLAIAGIVLVVALFIFNLTITNGTINPFIFYVNILSINFSLIFPKCPYLVNCLLLSLFNLDLGIETCFYDGMDDYAKTLLRLSFPLYLIILAICLIVGSRYSTKIQRLTAQRALPVLATLFLLSYTKILLTVCEVLFCYSSIIRIPNNSITMIWMVDVSAPLFGVKFLIAFLPCIIMLVISLFFNFLLLFARKLSHFKVINTFKPLLDAYFGPYKDKFYYWTGLQLLVRATVFGISAVNDQCHLTGGIIILGLLLCKQSYARPYKSKFKNFQESFILLNLQAVYIIRLLYLADDDITGMIMVQVLVSIVLVNFIISVIVHCMMPKCNYNKVTQISNKLAVYLKTIFNNSTHLETVDMEDLNNCTSGNYHVLQDSLIEMDN